MVSIQAAPLRGALSSYLTRTTRSSQIQQHILTSRTPLQCLFPKAGNLPLRQQEQSRTSGQRRYISQITADTSVSWTPAFDESSISSIPKPQQQQHIKPEPEAAPEANPITQPTTPLPLSLQRTLPLLQLQSADPSGGSLYATIHIHARPYLLTLGDKLRLPFLMPNVQPGDILRLTHASTLGTRDYTLRGAPWVDSRVFEARAVVGSVESEPMRVMEKTKRRVRKIKHVRSKHRYTEVLVTELRVRTVEEMRADGVFGEGEEVVV